MSNRIKYFLQCYFLVTLFFDYCFNNHKFVIYRSRFESGIHFIAMGKSKFNNNTYEKNLVIIGYLICAKYNNPSPGSRLNLFYHHDILSSKIFWVYVYAVQIMFYSYNSLSSKSLVFIQRFNMIDVALVRNLQGFFLDNNNSCRYLLIVSIYLTYAR